jgi:dTDP-glucose 4,6-dehydratase
MMGSKRAMKHIIFGGDGFLGRHLARELLARGEQVVICDIRKSNLDIYDSAQYIELDITDRSAFAQLKLSPGDIVHHYAARLLVPIVKRPERDAYFWSVNFHGTRNVLDHCYAQGVRKLVYFTTDMVYGHTRTTPKTEDHPREPLGPYGAAKAASEDLCEEFRQRGMNITIFRPRLIIGPGRLGILENLFKLVDANLPVPVIGNAANNYQFISVFDCVGAILAAVAKGVPNSNYNLGTANPPKVRKLLGDLIKEANSRSFILPTPAGLVKRVLAALDRINRPVMDPEQYLIADQTCVLDVSKAKREIGWEPAFKDEDMLIVAYRDYRVAKSGFQPSGAGPTKVASYPVGAE